MTRNLVIGSEGFIGKPFCSFLESIGEEVVRFDIKQSDDEDARFADLGLEDFDRVYFLAWDVGGSKYLYKEDAQLHQMDWNLQLLLNVMKQLQIHGTPFLFISSQLALEHDTVYGATKHLGEVWTKLLGGVFVRQWNVYGPFEEHNIRSHVVSDFVHQALDTGKIKMLTTGEEVRQFVHIDDVCSAWHTALSENVQGVHDVTSFEWVRIKEVAEIIAKYTGATIIPGKISGSTPLTPLSGKIKGWNPTVTLEEGIKRMIQGQQNKKEKL